MDEATTLVMIGVGAMVSGMIGAGIGSSRNEAVLGFWLGILLGPIGWIIVALAGAPGLRCPECGGKTVPGARRCKCCGVELSKADVKAPEPTPPPPEVKDYFVWIDGKSVGPMTASEVRAMMERAQIGGKAPCRRGESKWRQVEDFAGVI